MNITRAIKNNINKLTNIIMKSDKINHDKRLTQKPAFELFYNQRPGIKQPEISPTLPLLKYVHDNSPPIKIATMRLRESIFRRGFEWEEKFKSKCVNDKCAKEFEELIPKCIECGASTITPNTREIKRGDDFFAKCNLYDESRFGKRKLISLLKQVEDDLNIYDDAYIIGIKEYWQDKDGDIKLTTLHQIIRGNPIMMRMVADELGEPGGRWVTCLRHRDVVEDITDDKQDKKCRKCGRKMYEVHFVSVDGGGETPNAYYIGDEIIHCSKYSPSQLYGFSPIVTLWQYALTLTNMIEYIYRSYTEQHLPKGVLAMKTNNPDSAYQFWQDVDDKLQKNPHYIPKMFLEGESTGTGSGMEFVKFMDTLEEMQFIPVRDEIRRTIASIYGVTNIFLGDTAGVGGLNSESTQIDITNMAAESGIDIYNNYIMPEILRWLNINDWKYVLQSPFEENKQRELNEIQSKVQIMQQMLQAGFDVELGKEDVFEFKYSGTPQKPQMGGFNNFNQPEMSGLEPEEPIQAGLNDQNININIKDNEIQKYLGETEDIQLSKEFQKELNTIFEEEINKILKNSEKLTGTQLKELTNRVTKDAIHKMRMHGNRNLRDLYISGQDYVAKLTKSTLDFQKVDEMALNAITKHKVLWGAYENMEKSLSEKINDIITQSYSHPETHSIQNMVNLMKEAADVETYRLERIVRTESHVASQTGRAMGFKKSDPDGKNLYKWAVRHDSRTSDVCSSIEKQIDLESKGKGVSLNRLNEIIKENSLKYNGKTWEYRDLVPHINCRSALVRAF